METRPFFGTIFGLGPYPSKHHSLASFFYQSAQTPVYHQWGFGMGWHGSGGLRGAGSQAQGLLRIDPINGCTSTGHS